MSREAVWRYRTPRGTFVGDAGDAVTLLGDVGRLRASLTEHAHALEVFTMGRFRATYRAQALGLIWPMANPTILMIVMSVFFGVVFPSEISAYPVFLMLGLIPWHFLSHAWTDGTTCFLHHSEVIKRTSVPAWVVATGTVLSHLMNLGFAALSIVPLVAFYPEAFQVSFALLALPLVVILLVALGLGLVLFSAVLNVVYRDVGYIVNSTLVVLFWATPIAYPMDRLHGWSQKIMLLNPVASIVQCIRDIVLKGTLPPPSVVGAAAAGCLGVLLLGTLVYRRFARVVADHV